MTAYSAITALPYHYPGGVIAPGQSAELSDDDAARGLASGQIVLSPQPKAAPKPAAPAAPASVPPVKESA
jgi:hypothetical protein